MGIFIFAGSLTEEDIQHLEAAEDLRPPEEVLGLTPEELRQLTTEDVSYLMEKAKARKTTPPVFINRKKIEWKSVDINERDGSRSIFYADRDQVMELPAYTCVHGNVRIVPAGPAVWKKTEAFPHHLYCPVCHHTFVPNAEWIRIYNIPTKFCPNCGTAMREVRKK